VEPKWLEWTQKLEAIAQNGLTYSENPFDIQRFQQLREIAAEIMATYSNTEQSYILDLFARDVATLLQKLMCAELSFKAIRYY
jgi:hypothetical protein